MYRVPDEPGPDGWRRVAQNQLGLLDSSLAGILVVDDAGAVLFANHTLARFLGQDHDAMVGRRFSEFLDEREARQFERMIQAAIAGGAGGGEPITFERRESGQWLELWFRRTLRDGQSTRVYFRDITARAAIEEELRERNAFLNGLIESSVDGIIAADMKGNIILFNRGAEQLLGYTEEEAIRTLHTTRLYVEGTAREVMRKMRSDDYGGRGKCIKHRVIALLSKTGVEIPVSLSGGIIYDADGKEAATFGIFTDLRQREAMARQLQEKQLELIQSEKLASLGKLAAGVAHEINNPLSGILIFASMVLEELPDDNPLRADLERVVSETTRCKGIVRELLDFAHQEEAAYDVVDLNSVIQNGIHLLRNQALFHNVEIVMDLQPDLPPAEADGVRLNQVVLNLAINAAEAMEGKGRLTITTCELPGAEKVRVTVADTGCGIPPEIKPQVFDPFFTTKEVGKGTGLGLSVSYRILRDCGGAIDVESAPGQGATFIVDLLAAGAAGETQQAEGS